MPAGCAMVASSPVGTTSVRTLGGAVRACEELRAHEGETDIFITPGYRFRVVDLLLTIVPSAEINLAHACSGGFRAMSTFALYAHAIA